jgi:hypothetical protein
MCRRQAIITLARVAPELLCFKKKKQLKCFLEKAASSLNEAAFLYFAGRAGIKPDPTFSGGDKPRTLTSLGSSSSLQNP